MLNKFTEKNLRGQVSGQRSEVSPAKRRSTSLPAAGGAIGDPELKMKNVGTGAMTSVL